MTAPTAPDAPAAATTGSSRPLPGPFVAAALYAARVCVPPKRALLLALPCVAAVLFGLLARLVSLQTPGERFAPVVGNVLLSLVLPLACLVVGDAVLGAEVRSGTFVLTWLSPTSFPTIVLARWLAGWAVATAALVPAMVGAAIAAGAPGAIAPLLAATIAGSAGYIALFVFIGATVRRAALWSLAVVLLGERLLGTVLTGIAQLSPQWLARMVYADWGPDADELVRRGMPLGGAAVLRLVIVTVVALFLAIRRIRNLSLVSGGE